MYQVEVTLYSGKSAIFTSYVQFFRDFETEFFSNFNGVFYDTMLSVIHNDD